MNHLLSNQNIFIFTTFNSKSPDNQDFVLFNEFEGFLEFLESEMAINIFGVKENTKKDRIRFARDLLIKMVGREEFERLKDLFQQNETHPQENNYYTHLDDTERVIFKLIAKGFERNEIAELLDFSGSKVDIHQNRIFEKMNFAKKADLLDFAYRNRLV
jgi:DNA-binding CsgD family transcriptional regulator